MAFSATAAERIHRSFIQRMGRVLDRIDRQHRFPNRIETYYLLNVMDGVADGRFSTIEDPMLRAEAATIATPDQILSFTSSCPTMSMNVMHAKLDTLAGELGR
jgi:hypothetical protein